MEEGRFGKDRIILYFFSPDGATRGGKPISERCPEATVTIFVHTLLYQLISSTPSGKTRIPTASGFLRHLLDSIDSLGLLDRFKDIGVGDPLAITRRVLDIPVTTIWDALGKALETEKDLGIVINVLDNMAEWGDDFLTAISTFIRSLSERTPRIKALLTSGPVDGSGMTLGGCSVSNPVRQGKERFDSTIP
jgi:hypothetical protein